MSNIPETGRTSRVTIRLVAIQILVFSLLLTLGGRLWYLQIRNGDEYPRRPPSNHVQQVVQPAVRGSILDARGVPLADNETRLVVSASRTELMKMTDDGKAVLDPARRVLGMTPKDVKEKVRLCDAKTPQPCWNGSPYQPIPITDDASAKQALQIREREEDFPGITAEPTAVRRYAAPAGANTAQVLGYLSPVTDEEIKKAEHTDSPLLALRPDRPQRAGAQLRQRAARQGRCHPLRGRQPRPGDGSARESARPRPGANLVTSIDSRVQARRGEGAGPGDEGRPQAARPEHRHATYKADAGAVVVMEAKTGRVVAMASNPDVRPQRLGRRHLRQGLQEAHRQEVQLPAAEPGDPGPGRRPARSSRSSPRPPPSRPGYGFNGPYHCTSALQHRQPGLQELRVREPRQDQPRPRAGGLLRHRLLRPRLRASGRRTAGTSPRRSPKDWFYKTAHQFGLGRRPASTSPTRSTGRVPDRSGRRTTGRPTRTPGARGRQEGRQLRRADRQGELPRGHEDARR